MSDEERQDTQFTAEYKDGHLQIVEVTPFEKEKGTQILPDVISRSSGQQKFAVLDPGKGLVQLDLLNLTFVSQSEDGEEQYRLVSTEGSSDDVTETLHCVLASSDGEEQEQGYYVMVDGERDTLGLLQSSLQTSEPEKVTPEEPQQKKKLSPAELLEKAKNLRKAKALLSHEWTGGATRRRGRKRLGELPPAHELLASPSFKLFLYSCKQCSFKCNAIKELTDHKAGEHGAGRARTGGRGAAITLQCARCPFRGGTHPQLIKHVRENHSKEDSDGTSTSTDHALSVFEKLSLTPDKVSLDSKEVEEADVLVCGACGFESSSRPAFRRHISEEHGATS